MTVLSPSALTHLRKMLARQREQYLKSDFGGPIPTGDEAARLLATRIVGEDLITGEALEAFRAVLDAGGAWSAALGAAAPFLSMTPELARAWNWQIALERDALAHFSGPAPFGLTLGPEEWQRIDFLEGAPSTARQQVQTKARTALGLSQADAELAGQRVEYTLIHGQRPRQLSHSAPLFPTHQNRILARPTQTAPLTDAFRLGAPVPGAPPLPPFFSQFFDYGLFSPAVFGFFGPLFPTL